MCFDFVSFSDNFRTVYEACDYMRTYLVRTALMKTLMLFFILLLFHVVLDMQMYRLCRSISVYSCIGIVQNSIAIVCIRLSSYISTVHLTQVQFIPAHQRTVAFT